MKILHGTWIPSSEDNFIQNGKFYLWIEIAENRRRSQKIPNLYPRQLTKEDFANFLHQDLGISSSPRDEMIKLITTQYFLLPSSGKLRRI